MVDKSGHSIYSIARNNDIRLPVEWLEKIRSDTVEDICSVCNIEGILGIYHSKKESRVCEDCIDEYNIYAVRFEDKCYVFTE